MFYGFAVGCWRQRRFDPGINLTSVPTVGILFHSSGATKKTQVVRLFSKLLEDEKLRAIFRLVRQLTFGCSQRLISFPSHLCGHRNSRAGVLIGRLPQVKTAFNTTQFLQFSGSSKP
jgi:hypothetical protein